MRYVISSTERATGPGNEMETKALLHLMCFDEDAGDIDGFAIDFFNDVTGMDAFSLRLWDTQSKKAKSGPADLGRELVTLFKNYVSDFGPFFEKKILFVGDVTPTVLRNQDMKEFCFSDITDRAKASIRKNLIEECKRKEYVDDLSVTDEHVDAFLDEVKFIIAEPGVIEYIKPLIKFSSRLIPCDDALRGIFNEIRNMQSSKKNASLEGLVIENPNEVVRFGRTIKRREIELLIIERLVNGNPLDKGLPKCFASIYCQIPPEERNARIEDCTLELSAQMFDKNCAIDFWNLLEAIVSLLETDANLEVPEVYQRIDHETLVSCTHLSTLSVQYFIAIIKDGLQ